MYSVLKKKNLTHFNSLVLLVLLVKVPGQKRKLKLFLPYKLCVNFQKLQQTHKENLTKTIKRPYCISIIKLLFPIYEDMFIQ